ncbi:MAG: hypothetical protein M3Q99_13370 [Acidobacteriota bacterium]|nr:hypothetical protein [Acidobacteriota bacterium]
MTVILELEPEIELTATEQADEQGLPLEKYVEIVFKEAVAQRQKVKRLAQTSFREILAPIHQGFKESGLTEDEIIQRFEKAREDVWQEKQKSK